MRVVLIGMALIASIAGCNSSPYFRPSAFMPPLRHYRVRYEEPEAHRVLSGEWQLLNFRNGQIARGLDWVSTRAVDEGGGPRSRTVPLFDLFAEHARDGSALFIMTVPVARTMAHRDLRIVAHDFIDELTGSAIAVVRRAHGGTSEERLIASVTLEDSAAVVGGSEAYLVTLSRSVVGSASATASRLLTFVIIRPPTRWRASGLAHSHVGAPMLIFVGLECAAERYDAHRPELDALLDRMDIRSPE